MACCTKAVVATCVVFVPEAAVGAVGVPVSATKLEGMDAMLSIAQMPAGVPVATVAIDNSANAAILAAQMIATSDLELRERLRTYKQGLHDKVMVKSARVREQFSKSSKAF